MAKPPMFDAEALIGLFESATARQGEQLRRATTQATLAALQGRELTLKNIRGTLKAVADAASAGAARNVSDGIEPEALLDKAVAGIDDALLKAVEANRMDLRDKHLAKALADLEKMEDTMFDALKKAAAGATAPMAGPWSQVLEKMQAGGTASGAQAALTAEQLTAQFQSAVRSTRAASLRAVQAMAENYAAMASGVLIGMQEAFQSVATTKKGEKK
jgi:hypothetical protein